MLAGCTSTVSSTASTTATTRVIEPPTTVAPASSVVGSTVPAAERRAVRILLPPQSITDAVLEQVAAKLDASIIMEVYADPAFVLDRLLAQQGQYQYDVVVAPGAFLPAAIEAGLLQRIDPAKVPGLAGQLEKVKASPFDPTSTYSVCKEVGYTGYAWDRNVLPEGIDSWSTFIAAAASEEVSGKVTCLAEGAELLAIAQWAEGNRTGANFDATAASAFVAERLRPHLLDLDSGPSVRMAEGAVVLAQMWNGEGRRLVASDPGRWGYAIGAPVTGVWMERFVVPTAAPSPDLAAAFIDAMLQPDISLAQANDRGYNTGVAAIQADIAALDGVKILTDESMFGDSKDYGESLLDASSEELVSVVVGTIQTIAGTGQAGGTPTTTTVAAPSTAVATTVATAPPTTDVPDTTPATAPATTTTQVDQQGRRVLRPQDEGPEVKNLQERLKALGFSLGRPDGQYGDLTLAAVMAFQRSQGLQTDGVVGSYTWNALENPKPILTRDTNTRGVPSGAKSDAQGHGTTAKPSGGRTWVKAIIYLDSFRDEFYDASGKLVASFPNSPGVNGLTPTGTFHVYSRSAKTFFRPNPAETMEWMVRFNGGVGFHSVPRINGVPQPTPLGQAPSSHGCIRHADDVAKRIYDNLADNAVVIVRHG